MFRTRFAPTPSGFLHIGNAYSFILTWLLARTMDGVIWLRIDDLDRSRLRIRYVESIFRDLDWLGLTWDEGPMSVSAFHEHSQLTRVESYREAIGVLREQGDLFGCFCTRKEIRQRGNTGSYDGFCRGRSLQDGAAYRICVDKPEIFIDGRRERLHCGDFVVQKKDGLASYQLGSVVDDENAQMSCIIRGEDLYSSTLQQLYLAERLGYQRFTKAHFVHHPLIMNEAGKKLSKSAGAADLGAMRMAGASVMSVYRGFARWRGWAELPTSRAELVPMFREMDTLGGGVGGGH